MPRFSVRLFTAEGTRTTDVDAPDAQAVASVLRVMPQHVLEVREVVSIAPGPSRSRRRFPLRLFCQELAVLLDAGIPLVEALQTLRDKEPAASVRDTLDDVIELVRNGLPLSGALGRRPQTFDELMRAIVAANERTGQLASALAQHARYLAWVENLRSRLFAAAVYPLMLLGVGMLVILFLLLYVLPRFSSILDGLGNDLPWGSRVLIGFGQTAGQHPLSVLGAFASLVIAVLAVARRPATQVRLQSMAWRVPGIGSRLKVLALARLYRSLAMLLSAGLPVLPALRIVQNVVAAPWRAAVGQAAAKVECGERLSEALESEALATPVARRMVRVGERSGELATMLERAAAFHDDEVQRLTELLTRAINPALMLVMGIVIGGIIVLMYLPIFQLVEQIE